MFICIWFLFFKHFYSKQSVLSFLLINLIISTLKRQVIYIFLWKRASFWTLTCKFLTSHRAHFPAVQLLAARLNFLPLFVHVLPNPLLQQRDGVRRRNVDAFVASRAGRHWWRRLPWHHRLSSNSDTKLTGLLKNKNFKVKPN